MTLTTFKPGLWATSALFAASLAFASATASAGSDKAAEQTAPTVGTGEVQLEYSDEAKAQSAGHAAKLQEVEAGAEAAAETAAPAEGEN